MTHQIGSDEITRSLLLKYPGLDAYAIAQEEGLWMRPREGGETVLRGRVIAFDVTRPESERLDAVLRCVAEHRRVRARLLERLAACGDVDPPTEEAEALQSA